MLDKAFPNEDGTLPFTSQIRVTDYIPAIYTRIVSLD